MVNRAVRVRFGRGAGILLDSRGTKCPARSMEYGRSRRVGLGVFSDREMAYQIIVNGSIHNRRSGTCCLGLNRQQN